MQTGFEKLGNIKTTGFASTAANVGEAAKKMAEQVKEAANKTKASMTAIITDESGNQKVVGLREVTNAYKELYDLQTKMTKAKEYRTLGNEDWGIRLQKVSEEITEYRKANAALVELAASQDKVVKARQKYADAITNKIDTSNNTTELQQQKQAAENFARQQQQAIEALQQWQRLTRQMNGKDSTSQDFQELSR